MISRASAATEPHSPSLLHAWLSGTHSGGPCKVHRRLRQGGHDVRRGTRPSVGTTPITAGCGSYASSGMVGDVSTADGNRHCRGLSPIRAWHSAHRSSACRASRSTQSGRRHLHADHQIPDRGAAGPTAQSRKPTHALRRLPQGENDEGICRQGPVGGIEYLESPYENHAGGLLRKSASFGRGV